MDAPVAAGRVPQPAQGFGRDARLLTGAEYQRVFARSQRIPGQMLMVLYRKREPATGPARLGLAISRKHARRAVDRNRIKRVAREAFRARRPALPSVDLIVLSRDGARTADRRTLRAELDQLLGKVK